MDILYLFTFLVLFFYAVCMVLLLIRIQNLEARMREMGPHEHRAQSAEHKTQSVERPPAAPERVKNEPKTELKLGAWFYSAVGGVAVLLGLGFLLRYAIENNLISQGFRVLLGCVFGVILIGLGEWLRPKMKRYASILSGTGLGAWYISLYAASQLYGLLSLEIAFIGMMVVTGLGVFLALRADEQAMSVFAYIGGFLTPIILMTEQSRPHVTFPYLVILNAAMLLVAWKKPWRWLVGLGVFGSFLVTLSWIGTDQRMTPALTITTYLTLIFLQFLGRTLYRAWTQVKADEMDFVLLFLNPLLFVILALDILKPLGDEYQTALSLFLALLYLALAAARFVVLKKSETYDIAFTAIGSLCLALGASTFFDTDRWIIATWGFEALALRLAARKMKSPILATLSQGLFSVTGIYAIGRNETASYLWALAPFLLLLGWNEWSRFASQKKREATDGYHFAITHFLLLCFVGSEITSRWSGDLANALITVSWLVVAIALTAYGIWRKDTLSRYLAVTLFGISTFKIVFVDTAELDNFYRFIVFISLGLLLLLAGYLYNRFKGKIEEQA